MEYLIVKKMYDAMTGVYYYQTMIFIDNSYFTCYNFDEIIRLPHDCIVLERSMGDDYRFSKYNYTCNTFDETLEIR